MDNPKHPAETIDQQRARYTAGQHYQVINGQLYRQPEGKYKLPRFCPREHEVFDLIVKEHANELMHAGRDKTWAEIDRKYYGITKMEVAFLLEHCATCAKTRSGKTVAPLESIIVKELWERLQIDLIDFRHLGQRFKWCLHVRDHFSKFSGAYPMETKESENVALHLGGFIGLFGIPGILQCDNGTEFKGACDRLVKHHGIPVVHSKPRTPQTNGLIEQANGVLKSKILAWMTEMESTEWWLALPEAMLSMNRQVHSTTAKSPYEILFKQLMPDRPRISTAQRSTALVIEKYHDMPGLPITPTCLDTISESCIDPQLLGLMQERRESLIPEPSVTPTLPAATVPEVIRDDSVPSHLEKPEVQRAAAVETLNQEVIESTRRKVIAMEKRYNKINNVEVFEEGDLVRLKIPVEDRCTTDNKRIFCRVVKVKHGNRYALQCQYGILQGFYRTKNMDRLCATIPHQIPAYEKGSHRELTLREAARLQSPAALIQVRCGCKGNCATIRCSCFKAKVDCTLHCHGRNDGMHCTNTGASAALSGTFSLALNTAKGDQPGPSQNPKRRRANTRGDTWAESTSVEDSAKAGAEDSTGSDLSELDTEEGEDYEADAVTEEEEQEEDEEDEGCEDEGSEDEGIEEQTVSSNDMEHSVIVVAPRC